MRYPNTVYHCQLWSQSTPGHSHCSCAFIFTLNIFSTLVFMDISHISKKFHNFVFPLFWTSKCHLGRKWVLEIIFYKQPVIMVRQFYVYVVNRNFYCSVTCLKPKTMLSSMVGQQRKWTFCYLKLSETAFWAIFYTILDKIIPHNLS